jgi:endogenous inhibitor of DNA gyrase (YacG/DUF329 family)
MVNRVRTTRCPTCNATIEHTDADGLLLQRPSCAPFCSDRCKMADLGLWLAGVHAIPTDEIDDDEG